MKTLNCLIVLGIMVSLAIPSFVRAEPQEKCCGLICQIEEMEKEIEALLSELDKIDQEDQIDQAEFARIQAVIAEINAIIKAIDDTIRMQQDIIEELLSVSRMTESDNCCSAVNAAKDRYQACFLRNAKKEKQSFGSRRVGVANCVTVENDASVKQSCGYDERFPENYVTSINYCESRQALRTFLGSFR